MPTDAVSAESSDRIQLVHATEGEQIEQVRELFLEYASSLGFSLCFQNFEEELKNLPGDYQQPAGCLLLALCAGQPAGCVALRPLEKSICEMKRLYLRPAFRGKGIGKILVERVIFEARAKSYQRMRLDTVVSEMKDAIKIYRRIGFREIPPYRANPLADALYMELVL